MNELAIVGDRVFTDVILANRLRWRCLPRTDSSPNGDGRSVTESNDTKEKVVGGDARLPLAILTTGLWKRESLTIRWVEKGMVRLVERWSSNDERIKAKQELAARFTRTGSTP